MSPLQNLEPRPSETCSSSESTDGDGDFGGPGDVPDSDGQESDVHDSDVRESDSHDDSSTVRRVVRDLLFMFVVRAMCFSKLPHDQEYAFAIPSLPLLLFTD